MAALDFAFLAEFAKVEANATITAVGSGLRGVLLPAEEERIGIYVAGLVARTPGEAATDLRITTVGPNAIFTLERTQEMEAVDAEPSDFATTTFALRQDIPIAGEGRYEILVGVADDEPRRIELWIKFLAADNEKATAADSAE